MTSSPVARRVFLASAGAAALCGLKSRASASSGAGAVPLVWRQTGAAIDTGLIGRVRRSQAHYDGASPTAAQERVRVLAALLYALGECVPSRLDCLGDGTPAHFMMTARYAGGHDLVLSSIPSQRAVIRGTRGAIEIRGDRAYLAGNLVEEYRPLTCAAKSFDCATAWYHAESILARV